MISTEQWLRATKSTLTPKEPAHLRSPAMALAPIESLRYKQTKADREVSSKTVSIHVRKNICSFYSLLRMK